jgi:hypothetical protein
LARQLAYTKQITFAASETIKTETLLTNIYNPKYYEKIIYFAGFCFRFQQPLGTGKK